LSVRASVKIITPPRKKSPKKEEGARTPIGKKEFILNKVKGPRKKAKMLVDKESEEYGVLGILGHHKFPGNFPTQFLVLWEVFPLKLIWECEDNLTNCKAMLKIYNTLDLSINSHPIYKGRKYTDYQFVRADLELILGEIFKVDPEFDFPLVYYKCLLKGFSKRIVVDIPHFMVRKQCPEIIEKFKIVKRSVKEFTRDGFNPQKALNDCKNKMVVSE